MSEEKVEIDETPEIEEKTQEEKIQDEKSADEYKPEHHIIKKEHVTPKITEYQLSKVKQIGELLDREYSVLKNPIEQAFTVTNP